MREPGADCPECSQPIFRGKCTACGWIASAAGAKIKKLCAVCGESFATWHELHQGDDDKRRCASCHMAYLRSRRAEPDDACTEPGCTKTVREHIAEFRRYGERIGLRVVKL